MDVLDGGEKEAPGDRVSFVADERGGDVKERRDGRGQSARARGKETQFGGRRLLLRRVVTKAPYHPSNRRPPVAPSAVNHSSL